MMYSIYLLMIINIIFDSLGSTLFVVGWLGVRVLFVLVWLVGYDSDSDSSLLIWR